MLGARGGQGEMRFDISDWIDRLMAVRARPRSSRCKISTILSNSSISTTSTISTTGDSAQSPQKLMWLIADVSGTRSSEYLACSHVQCHCAFRWFCKELTNKDASTSITCLSSLPTKTQPYPHTSEVTLTPSSVSYQCVFFHSTYRLL